MKCLNHVARDVTNKGGEEMNNEMIETIIETLQTINKRLDIIAQIIKTYEIRISRLENGGIIIPPSNGDAL